MFLPAQVPESMRRCRFKKCFSTGPERASEDALASERASGGPVEKPAFIPRSIAAERALDDSLCTGAREYASVSLQKYFSTGPERASEDAMTSELVNGGPVKKPVFIPRTVAV